MFMYTCITRNKKKIIKRKIKLILKANHFISLNEHDELVQSVIYSLFNATNSHENEVLIDVSSKVVSYLINVHIVLVLQKVHAHQFWAPSSLLAVMHHMS